MAKKHLVEDVQRALARAKIEGVPVRSAKLSGLTNSGFRVSGYRVEAELPELTAEQRQALYAAIDQSLSLHISHCPMSGRVTSIWTEGV